MSKIISEKLVILIIVNIIALFVLCSLLFASPESKDSGYTADPPQPTVSDSEKSNDTAPVVVEPDKLSLSIYSDYITVGTSMKIEVSVSPSDASPENLTWKSSDPSVASIDVNGTVTGISKGSSVITVSAPNGVCAVKEIYVMNPGLIFLSPSRQTGNKYFDKTTDECKQAFLMSGFCKQRLEAVGFTVYECPIKPELEDRGRIAAEMDAKCYVAIHTNAGGIEQGTMAFFNRRSEASVRLANAVYETVSPITPDSDSGIKNGVKGDGKTYKEIQFPYEAGVPSTLLEVDYHDKEESARWLMNNSEAIGIAIADGIMRFMYENY